MNNMKYRILQVCKEDRATSLQRALAFQDLGHDLTRIFTYRPTEKPGLWKKGMRKLLFRLGYYPEMNNENKAIIERCKKESVDLIFFEKPLSIHPNTLQQLKKLQPRVKLVSYTLDDMFNPNNSSRHYRKSLPFYDFHFTNKSYNVKELKRSGARNVHFFRNAFSPRVHRPVSLTNKERSFFGSDVSFIGTFEKERAYSLNKIAEKGYAIKIWGWGRSSQRSGILHSQIENMNRYVYHDDYPKVVCSSKINLCFLRKQNRDLATTRSIELPACKGFMLAERTTEHLELFEEGKEAAFFSSDEELIDKIEFYLKNDPLREKIAEAGYNRCLSADYSYNRQLSDILEKVMS
jgi:spore maturation protein CgeB